MNRIPRSSNHKKTIQNSDPFEFHVKRKKIFLSTLAPKRVKVDNNQTHTNAVILGHQSRTVTKHEHVDDIVNKLKIQKSLENELFAAQKDYESFDMKNSIDYFDSQIAWCDQQIAKKKKALEKVQAELERAVQTANKTKEHYMNEKSLLPMKLSTIKERVANTEQKLTKIKEEVFSLVLHHNNNQQQKVNEEKVQTETIGRWFVVEGSDLVPFWYCFEASIEFHYLHVLESPKYLKYCWKYQQSLYNKNTKSKVITSYTVTFSRTKSGGPITVKQTNESTGTMRTLIRKEIQIQHVPLLRPVEWVLGTLYRNEDRNNSYIPARLSSRVIEQVLTPGSEWYEHLVNKMLNSSNNTIQKSDITRVVQIQNPRLLRNYRVAYNSMAQKYDEVVNQSKLVNQTAPFEHQFVFHGSSYSKVQSIVINGLNHNLNRLHKGKINGNTYGDGSYVALYSSVASVYATDDGPDKVCTMFICHVLNGIFELGRNPNQRTGNVIVPSNKSIYSYDSTTNSLDDKNRILFCVFEPQHQILPIAYIQFKKTH